MSLKGAELLPTFSSASLCYSNAPSKPIHLWFLIRFHIRVIFHYFISLIIHVHSCELALKKEIELRTFEFSILPSSLAEITNEG